MRTLRFAVITALSTSFPLAASALLVACGGDDGSHGEAVVDGGHVTPPNLVDGASDATIGNGDASPDAQSDAGTDVFTDAGAVLDADAADDARSPDATIGPPPGPPVCGDGWRDESTEECDDGDAGETCSATCRVNDVAVANAASDASTLQRSIAVGAHAVAAHASDFAAAVTTTDTGGTSLALYPFSSHGERLHVVPFSDGSTALDTSNPVVAAMPNGKYVVAWTDTGGDGDGQGVALRTVDPNAGTLGSLGHANTTTLVTQNAPDIVWTGSALVVAWADHSNLATGVDIKMRTFDASLVQIAPETPLAATTDDEADVSLCAFEGSWAAAWRSFANGDETVRVRTSGGEAWATIPFTPGPSDAPPALTELDAGHLLVAYTETIALDDAGPASTTRVRLAVLDLASSTVTPVDLGPASPASASSPQASPRLARVGGRTFVSWWTAASTGDPNGEEISLAEVVWSANASISVKPAIPLPRAHRIGDQRHPALTVMNGAPDGSLVAAWDDLGQSLGGGQSRYDVVLEVAPIPMLRLDQDGGP